MPDNAEDCIGGVFAGIFDNIDRNIQKLPVIADFFRN